MLDCFSSILSNQYKKDEIKGTKLVMNLYAKKVKNEIVATKTVSIRIKIFR